MKINQRLSFILCGMSYAQHLAATYGTEKDKYVINTFPLYHPTLFFCLR